MAEVATRDVADYDISSSFKGILRLSPNSVSSEGIPEDIGLPSDGTTLQISDSNGTFSPFWLGKNRVEFKNNAAIDFSSTANVNFNNTSVNFTNANINFDVGTSVNFNYRVTSNDTFVVKNNFILGSSTKIPTDAPLDGEVLVGQNGSYVKKNIGNLLNVSNPTGTIIHALISEEDIPLDPVNPNRKAYLFLDGSRVSLSLYRNLYNVLIKVINIESDGTTYFELPNIEGEHRYLMPTNSISRANPKIEESLPNITGDFPAGARPYGTDLKLYNGSFEYKTTGGGYIFEADDTQRGAIATFSASLSNSVYQDNVAVRPASFSVRTLIKT